MSLVSVSTPFNIDLDFEVAPFQKRVLAWAIDIILLLLYARGMKLFVQAAFVQDYSNYPMGLDLILVSMPMFFYHLLMEAVFQGRSLGKKLIGIRVISLEGGEPDIGQYLLRWIFRFWEWPIFFGFVAISSLDLIYQVLASITIGVVVLIIIAITSKSQRLGDLAAGTTVVSIRYKYTLSDTVFREITPLNYNVTYPEVMRLSDRDINAVKTVISQTQKNKRYDTAHRVAMKIKEVLNIQSDADVIDFLETLLADYNYLATKEA
jgi:uncharacterized RDD family membrane protein YckC